MAIKGTTDFRGFRGVFTSCRIRDASIKWSPRTKQDGKRWWTRIIYQHRHETGSVFDDRTVDVDLTDDERDEIMGIFYGALKRAGVVEDAVDELSQPEPPKPAPSEAMLNGLEAAKDKIDDRAEAKPTYRFSVSALQREFDAAQDNSLQDTDDRLSKEFDDLEARLENIPPEGLTRHTELSGKLFTKVGK